MLKRKIEQRLRQWKNSSSKKALCIIGARQIGKSTSARYFGKENYDVLLELNFIEEPKYKDLFDSRSPSQILLNISTILNKPVVPGKTLLLLDEIQECPEARTAIKFLVEDGQVDIIETGSLLGVNIHAVSSYPVGFEEIVPMYPLDFEEFLWAVSTRDETIDALRDAYSNRQPVNPLLHERMLQLFYRYLVIGGMPEAVREYIASQTLNTVATIQKRISDLYRLDILKYAGNAEKIKISNIYESLPSQLDAKNQRFKLSKLARTARMERYENSFLWLQEAGIALPCFNISEVKHPLKLNEKRNLFRLYLCDCGLLTNSFPISLQSELLKGQLDANYGSVLENAFAQAIHSKELPLYYFDNKKMELDFVVPWQERIQIVEIKSGADWKKHASLTRALADPEIQSDEAFVFCKGNVEDENGIVYLPFYMVMFWNEKQPEHPILLNDADELFGL